MKCGDVILLCDFLPPLPFLIEIEAEKFEGVTEENISLSSVGRIMEINYLPDLEPTGESKVKVYAAFRLQQLDVLLRPDNSFAQSARFGLTNFIFTGTDRPLSGKGDLELSLTLRGGQNERQALLQPIQGYSKIKKRVQTLKTIDVTCELILGVTEFENIEGLKLIADDLCYLLSLARSTKIQWIYMDQYDASGRLIMRSHSSRVAKPYCPLAVIDPRGSGRDETKTFLEEGYKTYIPKRWPYKLHQGTIDAYLDAKAESDYLEVRGVKLVVGV